MVRGMEEEFKEIERKGGKEVTIFHLPIFQVKRNRVTRKNTVISRFVSILRSPCVDE